VIWEKNMRTMNGVTRERMGMEKVRLGQENIFIWKEDIRRRMGEEENDLYNMDRDFKKFMRDQCRMPNMLEREVGCGKDDGSESVERDQHGCACERDVVSFFIIDSILKVT
jgi:hypothetical protein